MIVIQRMMIGEGVEEFRRVDVVTESGKSGNFVRAVRALLTSSVIRGRVC